MKPVTDRNLSLMLRAAVRVDRVMGVGTDQEIIAADENWDIHIGQRPGRLVSALAELQQRRAATAPRG